MSKGDLLRAIYEDENVTWYVGSDKRIASRRFRIGRGELYVEYVDRNDSTLATAHEIYRYAEYPYVEFRNKDGDVKGKAYLEVNLIGDPNVTFYDYIGNPVGKKFFDREKLDDILSDYYKDTSPQPEDEPKETEKRHTIVKRRTPIEVGERTSGGSIDFGPAIVLIFLACAVIHFLFAGLYAYADMIMNVTYKASIYGFVPLMFLILLKYCHPQKDDSQDMRSFCWSHILLSVCALASLVVLRYLDTDIPVPAVFAARNMEGLFYFLLFFVPTLVYGIFSGIWTLLIRGRNNYYAFCDISERSMLIVRVGSMVFIAVNLMVAMFHDAYVPGDFGLTIILILAYPFLGLLIFLASAVAYLPYQILSHFF